MRPVVRLGIALAHRNRAANRSCNSIGILANASQTVGAVQGYAMIDAFPEPPLT